MPSKTCRVCGKDIIVMCFRGTGYCSELCVKRGKGEGDPEPDPEPEPAPTPPDQPMPALPGIEAYATPDTSFGAVASRKYSAKELSEMPRAELEAILQPEWPEQLAEIRRNGVREAG